MIDLGDSQRSSTQETHRKTSDRIPSRTDQGGREPLARMHDTPPPIVITDSSLVIESDEQLTESSATRHFYKGQGRPDIAHVRIFQDTGDKIYEDLYAAGSTIKVVWINEDKNVSGDVIITGGSEFQIDSDKKLSRQLAKKRRKHKYEHPGSGGGKRIRIERIEVVRANGSTSTFSAATTPAGPDFVPDEFRILIWREDEHED